MERKTQAVYVIVRIDLSSEMDECKADEVVSEMDYRFDHPDIEDTEISDVSMSPLGF